MQERACRAGLQPSGICPYCDSGELEDHKHLWWQCAAWDKIRANHKIATEAYGDHWPNFLAVCGIVVCAERRVGNVFLLYSCHVWCHDGQQIAQVLWNRKTGLTANLT